jgi:hypothetical protein
MGEQHEQEYDGEPSDERSAALGETVSVELCFARDRRGDVRRVIVRTVPGRVTLWVKIESDGPSALRAAARALAACEAKGWTVARIEAFPWANELRGVSANDDGARRDERATRRARSGRGGVA